MAISRTEEENYLVADETLDARPAQSTATSEASSIAAGWDAATTTSAPTDGYPVDFKQSEDPQIIKFIDPDGPFAVYKLHFLQNKAGKKSYICMGEKCPLCTVLKHRPEDKKAFSIINFSAPDGPQRQQLVATPRLYKTIHAAHFSPQGPLTKNYWAMSRTGKMQTTVYHMNSVKARDLNEDWGLNEAEVEAAVPTFKPYDRSIIKESSYQELLEIAQELVNE